MMIKPMTISLIQIMLGVLKRIENYLIISSQKLKKMIGRYIMMNLIRSLNINMKMIVNS